MQSFVTMSECNTMCQFKTPRKALMRAFAQEGQYLQCHGTVSSAETFCTESCFGDNQK